MVAPNRHGGYAIGIDLGTSNTVAVVRWPDGRTRPLLFDGQPVLPSAVCLDSGGTLHVGRDAQRMAQIDPASFEPNPKRRIDESAVLLGERELTIVDLLAAPLRLVARTATEVTGTLPYAVLTYPAGWGPTRRQTLNDAAARAGWPPGRLVPEPIAAARYFSETLRRPVPTGSALAVFDFGGGTLDVALVRNDGSSFTIVGTGGASDLGGVDIDAALVAHLGAVLERDQPVAWRQITQPSNELERRHRRVFWDDVRSAKEMLSRTTVAPVAVPGVSFSLHLTRDELERLAGPLIERAVTELVNTMRQSGISPANLSGVFLVGGASRIPLVARQLHTELGMAPTVLEQPEMPVAEGALADLAVAESRRAPAPAPARPIRPAPTPAAPVSGHPIPAAPVSGHPASGGYAPTPPPRPMPPPPQRRKRSGRKVFAILAAIALGIGGACYGGWYGLIRPTPTFATLSEAQKIVIEGARDDGFLASFLTEQNAIALAQTGRQIEVAVVDLATGQVQRKRVGDAARWQKARLAKNMVIIASEPEPSGQFQLIGVSLDVQRTWTVSLSKDDRVGIYDLRGPDSTYVWWLEGATGEIKTINLDGKAETFRDRPKVPLRSQILNRGGEVRYPLYFKTPTNAILQYPSNGAPVTEMDILLAVHVMEKDPALYVTDQTDGLVAIQQHSLELGYTIRSSKTKVETSIPGRSAVWIGHCDQALCAIDEIPNQPASRELVIFDVQTGTNLSKIVSRDKVPYADPLWAQPTWTSTYGQYVIVPTRRDNRPGAVVINTFVHGNEEIWDDRIVGTYSGYLIPAGRSRGLLFSGDSVGDPSRLGTASLTGVDFNGSDPTRLSTQTARPSMCPSNDRYLLCSGSGAFTLYRL